MEENSSVTCSYHFPATPMADYQGLHTAGVRVALGASSIEAPTLSELLELASPEQITRWQQLRLAYGTERGELALREIISTDYPGLSADNILIFNGAQEALFCAFQALALLKVIEPGAAALGITPSFEPLVQMPRALGVNLAEVALQFSKGAWNFDLSAWRQSFDKGTRLGIINFPHNPTGTHIVPSERSAIIERAAELDAWLLSDEVFRGLESTANAKLAPIACGYDRAISVGSVAKVFGLGGLRLAWLACQNSELLDNALRVKRSLSICPSRADELLAGIALENASILRQRSLSMIEHNRNLAAALLSLHPAKLECVLPEQTCVAFPRLMEQEATAFAEVLYRRGITVMPGQFFDGDRHSRHFRLGLGRGDFELGFRELLAAL